MDEKPNTTASPLCMWNMSTFITWRSDTCYKAAGVIWLKPGLSDRYDIRLVAINEVCKGNRLVSDGSDVHQTSSQKASIRARINTDIPWKDQQQGHPWTDMFVGVCYATNMFLYCQEGVVDPVETWVNARLKLYGGKGREREIQTWGNSKC